MPWIAIAVQLAVSEAEGPGPPGFVYGIFVSLLVLFSSFAVNMWLQYRGVGRWKDPVFAERAYLSPQPGCQERPRLAGLRRRARRRLTAIASP